jgi:hypothetical protein
MRDIVISQLDSLLKTGDIRASLEVTRTWLAIAEPGEPEQLLAECNASMRPKVALLMRDLLSRYPSTIVGVPMLLFAAPDFEDTTAAWGRCLKLPFPNAKDSQPCVDLEFLGWLPAATPLPVALPFDAGNYSHEVAWSKPTSMVALFRSQPGLFDLDTVELPNQWWGALFRSVSANIHLTARLLLPYPDALEAARVMQAYARGENVPTKGQFLTDSAWSLACDEAAIFQESCRHLFREPS